jgi:hypothetical protein
MREMSGRRLPCIGNIKYLPSAAESWTDAGLGKGLGSDGGFGFGLGDNGGLSPWSDREPRGEPEAGDFDALGLPWDDLRVMRLMRLNDFFFLWPCVCAKRG